MDWGLPGGAMELGESLEQTASRELFEETGLVAESFQLMGVFSGEEWYYRYPNGDETYNVIVLYRAIGVTGILFKGDGKQLVISGPNSWSGKNRKEFAELLSAELAVREIPTEIISDMSNSFSKNCQVPQ